MIRQLRELRIEKLRQYSYIGDREGASAPLRARALKIMLHVLRRDETGARWTLDDEDVQYLCDERHGGRFLKDLLDELRDRQERDRSS